MGRGRRLCRVAILRVGFRVGFVAFLLVDLRESAPDVKTRLSSGVAAAPVAGVLSVFFLPVWEMFCNCRGRLRL